VQARSPGYFNDFFAREFWRFVLVQQEVEKLALTAVDYSSGAARVPVIDVTWATVTPNLAAPRPTNQGKPTRDRP
jgi:hypothetical protein